MSEEKKENPFVGLRPFDCDDSLYFFGRDEQIKSLLSHLHRCRFLGVVGSSGCGKSSLVRAGLIPHLQAGFLVQDRDLWRIAKLKPGDSPLRNLAEALAEIVSLPPKRPLLPGEGRGEGNQEATTPPLGSVVADNGEARGDTGAVLESIREGGLSALLKLVGLALDENDSNLLILVDQFEELFRFASKEDAPARYDDDPDPNKARFEGDGDASINTTADSNALPEPALASPLAPTADAVELTPSLSKGEGWDGGKEREGTTEIRESSTSPSVLPPPCPPPDRGRVLVNSTALTSTPSQEPADEVRSLYPSPSGRRWPEGPDEGERLPFPSSGRREEAAEFVNLLLDLASQTEAPVYVCITMRSDFLGDCDRYYGLPEAMNRGQYLVPRLTRSQRREAIAGPVHLSGAAMAPRLVDRLLNENIGTRDDLPVLQHALMRTWAHWQAAGAQGCIDLPDCEAIGGVREALHLDAEQAFAELLETDAAVLPIARRLFQCITETDPTNRRMRRPANLSEIAAVAQVSPEELWQIIDKFRENGRNFLVLSSEEIENDPLVDISHESLIRQWKRLESWVDEESESARLYRRLHEAALLHREGKAEVWRGAELQTALEWRDKNHPDEHWTKRYGASFELAMTFLDESSRAAKDEALEKDKRQRRELKRSRMLNFLFAALLAVSLVGVLGVSWWAQKANEQQRSARQLLYVANLNLAQNAYESKNYGSVDSSLNAFLPKTGDSKADDLCSFPWYYLWRWLHKAPVSLSGHSADVISVAFSPDGRTLASGSLDNTVRLWDVASGKEIVTLKGHSDQVYSVAFSPDGRKLASGSFDKTIKLWDVASGKETAALTGHSHSVESVAFSPDGRTLASGSFDKTVKLWDVASGKETATLIGHSHNVESVAFSPDGRTLASGSLDKTVKLWDVATGKKIASLTGHSETVSSVAFSPTGRILASGSWDETVKLWDVASGKEIATLKGHLDQVYSVAFSPDGSTLASCSLRELATEVAAVRLWDVASGKEINAFYGQWYGFRSVAFSPDGGSLASGSADSTVKLWNVANGTETAAIKGHSELVYSVAFSPDGRSLASGSADESVKLWDVASGKEIAAFPSQFRSTSVALSPDGKTLASGLMSGFGADTVKLWNVASGKEIASLGSGQPNLSYFVNSVAFSPDGKTLAFGSNDKTVKLWDVASGRETATLTGHSSSINSVAFSPDGKSLASGSEDKTVKLWDVASGKETATLTGHSNEVSSVAFSPNGKSMVSGSWDHTVKLWDVASGKETASLTGHSKGVTSVAFSPDGKILASGSSDNTVKLWDVTSGRETVTLTGHSDTVSSLAFSPDGRTLASGSADKTIRLWRAATDEEVERQRNR